eukprot:gene50202-68219_t
MVLAGFACAFGTRHIDATEHQDGLVLAIAVESLVKLPAVVMREFTARAVITGVILGTIFGASSLYLVLKVGITVSASIPVAVISLALFRGLSKFGVRDSTILENNITQTAGSAGESIAFSEYMTIHRIKIDGIGPPKPEEKDTTAEPADYQ